MTVQDGNLFTASTVSNLSTISDLSNVSDLTPVSDLSPVGDVSSLAESPIRLTLLFIYSTILLLGIVSVSLMARNFKSTKSVITIALINLTIAHSLLLATIPFRLYYYASGRWDLGMAMCKIVSGMIHMHMYLTFLFYVVILVLRIRAFHCQENNVQFYRNMHALLASLGVWTVSVVVMPCILYFNYGLLRNNTSPTNETQQVDEQRCFHFGVRVEETEVKVLNYIISTVICGVPCLLMVLQLHIIYLLTRKPDKGCLSQQQFNTQVKSLLFTLVMMVCFVPYQLFRLHYVANPDLESVNEVFLTLTALSCFDTLVFKASGLCQTCVCACVAGEE